jgi:hypothetical protein
VLALTGCVSMASSGPALEYKPTQGSGGSGQQYLQAYTVPPGDGWSPMQIVQGFLAANASFSVHHQVAREYLTSREAQAWSPGWSARVFTSVPSVKLQSGGGKTARTAIVTVSGAEEASVSGSGAYAVPSTAQGSKPIVITLQKSGGQWRISSMSESELLLSAVDFAADYQSRNLYFFNPARSSLVADPVYVPLDEARADPVRLLKGLVKDLIAQPGDWLSQGATVTAFPAGTKLQDVTLAGGTANVYLTGKAISRAPSQILRQLTAQLLWTLTGSGNQPAVASVELSVNGMAWSDGSGIAVQQEGDYEQYAPPAGSGSTFYYLDAKGDVLRQAGPAGKAAKVWTIAAKSPRLTSIAVSPDGRYLAGLSGGSVYIGPVGGRLKQRVPGNVTSLSWDSSDQLWLAGDPEVEMVPASGGAAVPVAVISSNGTIDMAQVTALRVAPDGVRVAVVTQGVGLSFGAVVETPAGRTPMATIMLSPFSVTDSHVAGVTWYGPDNVIAVSGTGAGSVATEYPVNGGTPTPIRSATGMANITASGAYPLIASSANGEMSYNESVSGTWLSLNVTGQSVVYPG